METLALREIFPISFYPRRELGDKRKKMLKIHINGNYLRYHQDIHQNIWNTDKHWRLDKKTNIIFNFYGYLSPFSIYHKSLL